MPGWDLFDPRGCEPHNGVVRMLNWLRQLDAILRGDATRISALQSGRIETPVAGVLVLSFLLAALYGGCIGSYAIIRTAWSDTGVTHDAFMQLMASTLKFPLLFGLTLLITFPSLYVFNAIVGSRLTVLSVARLLISMIAVMMAVLASLGPILVFFSASTTSYPFMKVLNVVMASIAGFLGLAFLLRTLGRLAIAQRPAPLPIDPPQTDSPSDQQAPPSPDQSSALDSLHNATDEKAALVFRIWVVVFSIVGAQMSWVLRPFIGSPDMPFTWFRERQGNFFLDVAKAAGNLLGL